MTIYLIKGYLDMAATSLADAQALYTALLDQTVSANLLTIDRVSAKLETLVQSDTGEPLIISSIDDAAGTISSWVTDSSSVAVGLGDADPHNALVYASLTGLTVSGSTRIGTLALNTNGLQAAMSGWGQFPPRVRGLPFTLHIQITSGGTTETMGLLAIHVRPGVLTAQPTDLAPATYLTAAQVAAGYQPLDSDLTAIAALSTTSFGRSLLTQASAAATRATLKVPTTLYSLTTAVGNIGAGEDDLISQIIAAGTLATNGDRLRITAVFVAANNANAKTFRGYFGATKFHDSSTVWWAVDNKIVLESIITRLTATTQNCSTRIAFSNSTAGTPICASFTTAAETLANAITLKFTGEATATDDIVQKEMMVEYLPAP